MPRSIKFADDGWALWISGNDASTIYLHEWINTEGRSYIDVGIRIRAVKDTHDMKLYIPFAVEEDELEDLSFQLQNAQIFRATFDSTGIYEPLKNEYTSEIAYKGEVLDLVHLSLIEFELKSFANGTLLHVPIGDIMPYIDNDAAYFFFRLPHKTLTTMCIQKKNLKSFLSHLKSILTSPFILEKYGHSVRINESRLLPDGVTNNGEFLRQRLDKAILIISIHEDFQVNDSNCYRIQRLEENLYKDFAPETFDCTNAITYQWRESREGKFKGHYNFYINVIREKVSRASMIVYLILLVVFGAMGDALWELLNLLAGVE